jgi:hypothetical protein
MSEFYGFDVRFGELPREFQNLEMAHEWFLHKIKAGTEPLEECYYQIPISLRFPNLVPLIARDADITILEGFDTRLPGYRELAEAFVRKNYKHADMIDPDARREMMPMFCAENITKIHSIAKEFEWFMEALSPECFKTCAKNIEFLLDTPEEQIPENIRRYAMIENYCVITALTLRARARVGLLADQISAGGWPNNQYVKYTRQPTSLSDGVERLSASVPGKEHETLYMAYLMTQPMDQVVPLMTNRRLQKLLFEMYSTESLQPYLKKSRALRGSFLEDSIGL